MSAFFLEKLIFLPEPLRPHPNEDPNLKNNPYKPPPFLALACRRALAPPPPPPPPSTRRHPPPAAAAAHRPPPAALGRAPSARPRTRSGAPPSGGSHAPAHPRPSNGGRGWGVPQGRWQSWPCGGSAGERGDGVSRFCRGLACRVRGGGCPRRGGVRSGGCDCVPHCH